MIRKSSSGQVVVFTLVPDQTLNDFDKALQRFPARARQRFTKIMSASGQVMVTQLAHVPPKFVGKRTWTSERQRRAYFATNGFGKGIPYKRTGALSSGWKSRVVNNQQGIKLVISNPVSYEDFVTGQYQQIMHSITGWRRSEPIVEREAGKLLRDLTQASLELFDRLGTK